MGRWSDLAQPEPVQKNKWSSLAKEPEPSKEPELEQEQEQMTWGEALTTGAKNIPKSSVQVVKDIWQTVRHPIVTGKAVGKLGMGVYEKLTPGIQEHEVLADQVWNSLKEQYGNEEAIKKTIAEKPAQIMMDLSGLIGGAGAIVSGVGKTAKAAKLAKTATALSKTAKGLATTAKYTDPFNLTKAIVKSPLKAIPEFIPKKMYISGLKPSTTLSVEARDKIVTTALSEKLPLTSGLKKSQKIINGLNEEIQTRIAKYADEGYEVSREAVIKPLEELKESYLKNKVLPKGALKEVDDVIDEFAEFQPENISIAKAQRGKQDLNKTLNNFYKKIQRGDTLKPDEWGEVRSALADGLRQEITNIFPEVKFLNKREGALIQLNKELSSAVKRINNKNIFSLIGGMYGSAGGAIGGIKGAVTLMMANYIFNNPRINSRLAIALYHGKHSMLAKGTLVKTKQAAYQAGKTKENQ